MSWDEELIVLKMNYAGISDSAASILHPPAVCPQCHAQIRVSGDECLTCLLELGMQADDSSDGESLDNLLAQIQIRDTDWRLGNYHILEEIGRGGMGVIYRARQRHSRRIVALKRVLSFHGDSRDTLERFRREAEAAASLDHPNILPIYEVGQEDGLPFFTMKYATGGTLQQAAPALRENPRECVRLLAKIAGAVAYAHRAGILHRDLKPGNILLDSHGEPLVSDFGLAKWIDTSSDLTRSLAIFGTPGFIAPEQAAGKSIALTSAADVYSLGAILFDLLTGRPPFLGEHAIAVIHQAAETSAPKLRSLRADLDRDLETICAKCLEREGRERYSSATDLADDLESWLQQRPITARPVGPATSSWRWVRRNPVLASMAGLLVLAAGVALTRQMNGWRLEQEISSGVALQHSVQVMPFLDLDSATDSSETAQELSAELEEQLNAIGPAKVTFARTGSETSSASIPPIADGFSRSLLSGTTRIANGKRRLSIHLLEANSHAPLLNEIIESDRETSARTVATAVAPRIYSILSVADLKNAGPVISDPGLRDPEAKRFIDQGLELANRRSGLDFDRAITCLRHAVELQPKSAAAHAALAKILGNAAGLRASREPLSSGLEHAREAVRLDASNADAHVALAGLLYCEGKINDSIQEAFVSLENSPSSRRFASLIATQYKMTGRPDKALLWRDVASQGGDPRSRDAGVADCFAAMDDFPTAENIYTQARQLHPEQPEGWMGICRLRIFEGRVDEARAIYQAEIKGYIDFSYTWQMAAQVEFFGRNFVEAEKLYERLYQQDPSGGGEFHGAITYASALGRIWLETDSVKGRNLLEQALDLEKQGVDAGSENPAPLYRLAALEASLGKTHAALTHLQAAIAAGWIDYRSLRLDPRFDTLHEQPRFQELIEAITQKVAALRNEHSSRPSLPTTN